MLELWNKLHFEEEKRIVNTIFKIFITYICWINIRNSTLEVSGAVQHLYVSLGFKGLVETYYSRKGLFVALNGNSADGKECRMRRSLKDKYVCDVWTCKLFVVSFGHMVRHPRCVFINYNWINQLSNTTIWWLDICCLLHRYQPHV